MRFAVLFVIGLALALTASADCTFEGKDFSSLGSSDMTGLDTEYQYNLRVCGTSEACSDAGMPSGSLCQFKEGRLVSMVSSWTGGKWEKAGDEKFIYKTDNGDECYDASGIPGSRYTSYIFTCAESTQQPVTVRESPACYFEVEIPTKVACKDGPGPDPKPKPDPEKEKEGGMSGGTIFLIALLVLTVVYFLGGVIFNIAKNQKKGAEAIPNREFWTGLPGLVKDGCKFTWNLIRSGCKSGKTYDQV